MRLININTFFKEWIQVIDISILLNTLAIIDKHPEIELCPSKEDVFKAFKLCPFNDLKIVIIGQDPYPQKHIATGIAFGNNLKGGDYVSPSLNVIKESLMPLTSYDNGNSFDYSLESWAKQGILLLNSSLTTEVNKIGVHFELWKPFVSALIKNLNSYKTGIIYVLFGEQAKTFKPYINSRTNDILEERHPAYYARMNINMPNTIFTTINNLTIQKNGIPIKWYFNNN